MASLDESPSDQRAHELLGLRTIAWFATIHPDGKPHIVPVWFLWHSGTALVLSQPRAQKVRNLAQNAHCSLAIDDSREGHEPLVFDGVATLEPGGISPNELELYVQKYSGMLEAMSWTPDQMVEEYSQLIRVTPVKFLKIA